MGSNKQDKKKWHLENRDIVFNFFNGICQNCNLLINKNLMLWDVHHLHYHYKNRLYQTGALELIENNIITLVCRTCHDKIHTAVDKDNPQHLENKYNCERCGKLEYGIFDRKKTQNLDKLLCRSCFLSLKKNNNNLSLF